MRAVRTRTYARAWPSRIIAGRWPKLLLLVPALALAGCWDRTEINDLAIITSGGIDLTENGRIELVVRQSLISAPGTEDFSSMGGGQDGSAGLTIIRSVEGQTMAEASSRLQQVLSRKLFWGQDEVFVFGRNWRRKGSTGRSNF